jgi:hypothetical protein
MMAMARPRVLRLVRLVNEEAQAVDALGGLDLAPRRRVSLRRAEPRPVAAIDLGEDVGAADALGGVEHLDDLGLRPQRAVPALAVHPQRADIGGA